MPVLIIALNWVLFRASATRLEGVSILLSLLGVLLILSAGKPLVLLSGQPNPGDLWVLAAVLVWALYSTLLRWRPAGLEPLAFLGFTVFVGVAAILPLWLWELSQGASVQADLRTLSAVGYVALFPSVLSYLFWNRGVAEIGANRAGHFIHLGPVFGSVLAILLLGEVFAWYHAVGGLMVAMAIGLTIFAGRR